MPTIPNKLANARDIDLPKGTRDAIFFTDKLIAAQLFKADANLPSGFGLRLRRGSGGRTIRNWIIQYRQHGRARRVIIGSADTVTAAQALERARKLHAEVELGGDPQADKHERREKDALNLRSIINQFLEYKKTTTVKQETLRLTEHYLFGPLGSRAKGLGMKPYLSGLHNVPVDQITRKDLAARLLAVAKTSGASTAILLRSSLSQLFSWAMTMGLIEVNPVVGAFKPERPASRDRVLDNAELAAIWKSVDEFDYGKVVRLLILTGCRRSEIAGMRWSEFNDDMSTWTLPKERAKNGTALTLPVTPLMAEIIKSVLHRDGFDVLFGRRHAGFTGWSVSKQMIDEKLGLKEWVLHDIRRSVATGLSKLGVQPHVIEAMLNHQSGSKAGVAGVYNRNPYEREVNQAMLMWSDHISNLIKGGERKVESIDVARKRRTAHA
jgi:integrase